MTKWVILYMAIFMHFVWLFSDVGTDGAADKAGEFDSAVENQRHRSSFSPF